MHSLILALTLLTATVGADLPPVESGTVEVDGESIYYETAGEGPVLVFSHGLGGNHAIWYQQVVHFAPDYRVVTWDQRGFGRSTNRNNEAGPLTAAKDLAALVEYLGIDKATFIGQSMGGWTVMGFALAHPERVERLVFADTIAGIIDEEIGAAFDAYIRTAMAGPPPDELPIGRHPAIGENLSERDPTKAFLYTQIASVAEPAPRSIGLMLRQTSFPLDDVKAIEAPTLFIVGENDPIFSVDAVHKASTYVDGALVTMIAIAGHSPYFEMPGAWNAALTAFFTSE